MEGHQPGNYPECLVKIQPCICQELAGRCSVSRDALLAPGHIGWRFPCIQWIIFSSSWCRWVPGGCLEGNGLIFLYHSRGISRENIWGISWIHQPIPSTLQANKNWAGAVEAPAQCPQCRAIFGQKTHRLGAGDTIGSNVTGALEKCVFQVILKNASCFLNKRIFGKWNIIIRFRKVIVSSELGPIW